MDDKKKKFDVYGNYSVGVFLGTYEAETAEEAISMAEDEAEGDITLCWQCNKEVGNDLALGKIEAFPQEPQP